MSRTLSIDTIRGLINLAPTTAVERLNKLCDAMDEDPRAYRFEFVVEDENVGNEGERDHYYTYRLPAALCPEAFTSSVYIECPERNVNDEDGEIEHFRWRIFDNEGDLIADSDGAWYQTCRECITSLNEELGWKIERKE